MSYRRSVLSAVVLALMLTPLAMAASDGQPVSYENHKLVAVTFTSPDQIETMREISRDHWSDGVGIGTFNFRVAPDKMDELRQSGLEFVVLHHNIQEMIDAERAPRDLRDPTWFQEYKTYDEINAYMNDLAALRPDLVSIEEIGQSMQGRAIYAMTIVGLNASPDNPAVCFNGTQHAREWISPMTVMYITDHLIRQYGVDPEITDIVDDVTFYIVPVVNPDGYIYSWNNDRLWRKNRRNNGDGTYGVDLNRNWQTGWGGPGSSGDTSDLTYRGPWPFSESETIALRDFIQEHPDIVAHIDFHSYSQLVLWAWGYQESEPPEPDRSKLRFLGNAMADEIFAVHGETYIPQPSYELYLAGGVCADWVYDATGALSYTIELRPPAGTWDGFILEPEQIIPTGEENLQAALFMADYVSTPLAFDYPDGLPAVVAPDESTPVQVSITEIQDAVQPGTAKLLVSVDGGAYVESDLTALGENMYEGTLPAAPCGRVIEYYFEAQTTSGLVVVDPEDAPDVVHVAEALPITVAIDDPLESDLYGWTVGAADDDATTGIWERTDPEATAAQPENDHTPSPGTDCYVTDGRSGWSDGSYDIDDGKTTLFSPVFDASDGATIVSYWRWYSNDEGAAPNADVFEVDISNDGGTSWESAEVVGPGGAEASGGWFYHEFLISDITPPTATMMMRFVASDEGSGSLVEAAVDDFRVVATGECPSAPGDLNCDGVVNNFDIDAFVLALTDPAGYQAAYPECEIMNGDINDDGVVNNFDIDPFVALLTGK